MAVTGGGWMDGWPDGMAWHGWKADMRPSVAVLPANAACLILSFFVYWLCSHADFRAACTDTIIGAYIHGSRR